MKRGLLSRSAVDLAFVTVVEGMNSKMDSRGKDERGV